MAQSTEVRPRRLEAAAATPFTPETPLPLVADNSIRAANGRCYACGVSNAGKIAPPDASRERSFEELAASQGVGPVTEFDALIGHPSAEDESLEDFAAMLRDWRSEATSESPR